MRYRLVLFDFDGTLADSFAWFAAALDAAAERHRFSRVAPDEVELVRGLGSRELLRHLGVPLWKVPRIAADVRRALSRPDVRIPLFPGVPELLRRLDERGVAIGIVTSNTEANVRRVLGPENARRVRHLACGASLFGKAARFRRVVRRSGAEPRDVLCVGDEQRDVEAAHAEGLAAGAVAWGFATLASLEALRPEEVFHSVEELTERLAGPG
jgi:phosphoglycolate phosphatase